jgi:DNA helicase-2/ATP-dependent DNA helicase PcrA
MEAARVMVETEEMKPKPRTSLRDLLAAFDRWRLQRDTLPHTELAEIVLDESGYTEMWQKDRSAEAAGRLENLKELIRAMEEFENLQGFLEHVSLIMDTDKGDGADAVSIMTLHSAKGLEFDTVYLPGWEEGLLPHQRALDDQGRPGLEEERRLAHVGLTRARKNAKIYFVSNRRIHGAWSSTVPSRFVDELPEESVEVGESQGGFGAFGGYGGYGRSRFDDMETFGSDYPTPGWQRAQARMNRSGGFDAAGPDHDEDTDAPSSSRPRARSEHRTREQSGEGRRSMRRDPLTIDGELVAKSTAHSPYAAGDRIFHQKFGYGDVMLVDGNKLTILFDKAGEKRVVDRFVERA